jgi:hypothetical protein
MMPGAVARARANVSPPDTCARRQLSAMDPLFSVSSTITARGETVRITEDWVSTLKPHVNGPWLTNVGFEVPSIEPTMGKEAVC